MGKKNLDIKRKYENENSLKINYRKPLFKNKLKYFHIKKKNTLREWDRL